MGAFDKCLTCTTETGRYAGCQDHCEHGIEAKRKLNERNKKIREAKKADQLSREYVREHYRGAKK